MGQIKKNKTALCPHEESAPRCCTIEPKRLDSTAPGIEIVQMVSEARYEYMKQIKITYVNRLHPMISCTRLPNSGHLHVRHLDSPELLGNYFIVRETISNFHALEMEADRLIGELRNKL